MSEFTFRKKVGQDTWRARSENLIIEIQYRPRLDKYDVVWAPPNINLQVDYRLFNKQRVDTFEQAIRFIEREIFKRDWWTDEAALVVFKELNRLQTSTSSDDMVDALQTFPNSTTKEQIMNATPTPAVIETKVFIHGCDATQMTDDEIFRHIANIEAEIDKLEKIKKKPKKLEAKIVQMGEDIKKLVEYVDSRN